MVGVVVSMLHSPPNLYLFYIFTFVLAIYICMYFVLFRWQNPGSDPWWLFGVQLGGFLVSNLVAKVAQNRAKQDKVGKMNFKIKPNTTKWRLSLGEIEQSRC